MTSFSAPRDFCFKSECSAVFGRTRQMSAIGESGPLAKFLWGRVIFPQRSASHLLRLSVAEATSVPRCEQIKPHLPTLPETCLIRKKTDIDNLFRLDNIYYVAVGVVSVVGRSGRSRIG